ncbi:CorA family divalent cation transporter [Azospirillum sp. SYSU D00513]|uniref:CorA family divalent cation transporter n=1 Tax=Azospirillum sp. SYSU D00513 TaxID=2812561 RepID=UPI001A96229E|nr:CorA family divalent cation transporter [Azospirillum sp. SYSU D00513]
MLHVFVGEGGALRWDKGAETGTGPLPAGTVWLDLLNPTPEELARAEAMMGTPLPTREQMVEIEESSRLRLVGAAAHLTVMALVWADTDQPRITPVSFVLAGGRLATVHHVDPQAFLAFRRRASRGGFAGTTGEAVLAALVEGMVERTAVVLRRIGIELDAMGGRALRGRLPVRGESSDDARTLRRIGQTGQLIGKAHVSLSSVGRMLAFLSRGEGWTCSKPTRRWVRTTQRDITGLDEYALFLSGKVNLLLDTALGQITIEQNEIVKIVSILTMVLLPPTLVATVFGMNFEWMPETGQVWGYPLALLLMLASAVVPLLHVLRRRWL